MKKYYEKLKKVLKIFFFWFSISLVVFLAFLFMLPWKMMRDDYPGAVAGAFYGPFVEGLYYVEKFPRDENDISKMLDIVKKEEPIGYFSYEEFKWQYRLIEEKDNEATFFIVLDSTKPLIFLVNRGFTISGIGRAKKNEKGEWNVEIEWFCMHKDWKVPPS